MVTNPIFTAVLLCLFCCEAWILKRQLHPDCELRTHPCLLNLRIIVRLFDRVGFESPVVNGHLTLQCSQQFRENTGTCLQNNVDCTTVYAVTRIVAAYEYMCEHEQGFVSAATCWNSDPIADTVSDCHESTEGDFYCSMPGCLEQEIVKIPGCTPTAASLFANMTRVALEHPFRSSGPCPNPQN